MNSSKQNGKAKRALYIFVRRSRLIPVLFSLCLMPLLSSCGSTQIKYVPINPAPIPSSLLEDCPVPDVPEPMLYGDSVELNEELYTSVENCNKDKAAIRNIEKQRQSQTNATL